MKIIYFLKRKLKIILIALILCLSVLALGGAAYYYVPKYFEAKQKDRDSTRKCKSYRALAEIAYGLYKKILQVLNGKRNLKKHKNVRRSTNVPL